MPESQVSVIYPFPSFKHQIGMQLFQINWEHVKLNGSCSILQRVLALYDSSYWMPQVVKYNAAAF
jgi:hypothetical protein